MPALDSCHGQVVKALEKAGWEVRHLPYSIRVPGRRYPLYADIWATQDLDQIIIVEVKCFASHLVDEVYTAIGQYIVYRHLMRRLNIQHSLYLAIPSSAYYGIFEEIGLEIIDELSLKLIIVNLDNEVIEQWIK